MISKAFRLSRKEAEALKNGKSVFTTLVSLRMTWSPTPRFSVSVSKKVAKHAVDRNKIRRRCYRAIETLIPLIKNPAIVMLSPKALTKNIPYTTLVSDIRTAFVKAGIVS